MNMLRISMLTAFILSASLAADPRLHLKNNSPLAIQVEVIAGSTIVKSLTSVQPNGDLEVNFDPKLQASLHIYFCPDAAWCKTKLPKKFIAQFPANKNIYVKWNGKKLEPQQGSIFGKTTKGYRTKNNVVQKDIRTSVTESPKMPPSKQQPAPKSKVEESWDQFPEAKKLFDQGKKVEAYRKVLGVSSSATASQISSAYKKLSLKWHPDKCVLKDKDICTEVQKILNEARDTLAK